VDVSGVGNSGKSVITDLLREVDIVYSPEYAFEFDLIRVPGGLLDFRYCLKTDWSPIRSHAAYFQFLDVVNKMGGDPAWWNILGLFGVTSQRYDRRFKQQFFDLSNEFANSFVAGTYQAEWPYDGLRIPGWKRLRRKLLGRMNLRRWTTSNVMLMDGKDFDVRALAFMSKLFHQIVDPHDEYVVLNNGFEPFNPIPGLDMLEGSRQIVVIRDPRDCFVSGLNLHNVGSADKNLLSFDNDGMNKSFLATDNLQMFVRRFRLYNEQVYSGNDHRILCLRFEDLVHDYEKCIMRIFDFLELKSENHREKLRYFDPEQSKKNIGLWRKYSLKDEIKFIQEQLPEFLNNEW